MGEGDPLVAGETVDNMPSWGKFWPCPCISCTISFLVSSQGGSGETRYNEFEADENLQWVGSKSIEGVSASFS